MNHLMPWPKCQENWNPMNPGEEEGNVLLQGFERPGVNLLLT